MTAPPTDKVRSPAPTWVKLALDAPPAKVLGGWEPHRRKNWVLEGCCIDQCDGEVGRGVFEDVGVAVLPGADLVLEAAAEGCRVERAAVEEDGVGGREVAEEICQIAGDGAVGGVEQAPLLERGVGLDGAGVGGNLGVEAVEQDGGDFVAGDAGGEGAGEQAGAAAG